MAGAKDVVVRAQSLEGTWETLGTDHARGVWPENVTLEADAWGPSRASFDLHRDARSFWPDIGAFTPIEVDVGGMTVWDGRVIETPARVAERVINVQAEGWQYHLDDDPIDAGYVHNDLTAWKDIRSYNAANLQAGGACAATQVNTGDGAIAITYPNGTAFAPNCYGGVFLDLGPGRTTRGLALDWETSNNTAGVSWFVRGTNDKPDPSGSVGQQDVVNQALNAAASGTTGSTFSTPYRYIIIFIFFTVGPGTTGADHWVRIKGARVFGDDSWRSTGNSILKASDVVLDSLTKGTLLLSPDRSGVQATSFNIPTFWPTEPRTVRDNWVAVDAYHNWRKQIAVGRRAVYQPLPSAPIYEVGPWSAMTDEDASANSGEEIYNRVLVTGQTPDGQPVRLKRGQVGDFSDLATQQLSNPSFDTNITGWSAFLSAPIARDTGVFDTSPASLKVTSDASFGQASANTLAWTSPLDAGTVYQVVARVRREAACTNFGLQIEGCFNDNHGIADLPAGQFATYKSPAFMRPPTGSWQSFTAGDPGLPPVEFFWAGPVNTVLGYLDSIIVLVTKPTIPDRRGFRRTKILPIQNALPPSNLLANPSPAGAAIGDTWLPDHKSTPFKGSVVAVGAGSIRDVLTGEDVPPERLLLDVSELIRFSDRTDPDTGGHGRDGRIAAVSYSPTSDQASVTIDNTRANFEALMNRFDLLAG